MTIDTNIENFPQLCRAVAWRLYKKDTIGHSSVFKSWDKIPVKIQVLYIRKSLGLRGILLPRKKCKGGMEDKITITNQIPGNLLACGTPNSTFGTIRNAAVIEISGSNCERQISWIVDASKERRKLWIRFMWWVSGALYRRYKPIMFYRCTMSVRLNQDEVDRFVKALSKVVRGRVNR